MPAYRFSRSTEALRRDIVKEKSSGPAFEAPAYFRVAAADGTIIPIPLALLADEASILVSQPDQCRPGERFAYLVQIDNIKGKLIPNAISQFGLKQATQRAIIAIIGLVGGDAAGLASKTPAAVVVGVLKADSLGNSDSTYRNEEGKADGGQTVYFALTGDRI